MTFKNISVANSKQIKTIFWSLSRNVLFPLAGILLLYFAFRNKDFSGIWEALLQVNVFWLLAPRVFVLLAHWARAYRWVLQVRTFGHKISVSTAFHAVMATYLVNIYLPNVGDFYRAWALKKIEEIPISRSIGTLVTEKIVDFIVLFILLGLSIIFNFNAVHKFFTEQLWGNFSGKIGGLFSSNFYLLLLAALLVLGIIFLLWIRKTLRAGSSGNKFQIIVQNIWLGIISVKNVKSPLTFIALSFFIFTCYWINFYLCTFAMQGTSELNLFNALFIVTSSAFSQFAPIQGGVGAFHWIVSQALMVFSVKPEIALAWATAMHAVGILFRIVTGIVGLLYLKSKGLKLSEIKKIAEDEGNLKDK